MAKPNRQNLGTDDNPVPFGSPYEPESQNNCFSFLLKCFGALAIAAAAIAAYLKYMAAQNASAFASLHLMSMAATPSGVILHHNPLFAVLVGVLVLAALVVLIACCIADSCGPDNNSGYQPDFDGNHHMHP
jgi:hypothetical protein